MASSKSARADGRARTAESTSPQVRGIGMAGMGQDMVEARLSEQDAQDGSRMTARRRQGSGNVLNHEEREEGTKRHEDGNGSETTKCTKHTKGRRRLC
jgi:hypothetical protein